MQVARMNKYLNVKVTGFRSLRNCSFRVNEGLNVLVGPNGSGKTNVAALLDFVSTFIQSGLYAAVAGAGGAVRVFSFESLHTPDTRPARMTVSVGGRVGYSSFDTAMSYLEKHKRKSGKPTEKKTEAYDSIEFNYFLSLILNREKFTVSIETETLSWHLMKSGKRSSSESISASATSRDDTACSFAVDKDRINARFSQMFSGLLMQTLSENQQVGSDFSDGLHRNAEAGNSLFRVATPFVVPEIIEIVSALSFDRSSNIVPDKVREDQDIASSGNVTGDGSGVISKLYKLGGKKSAALKRRKPAKATSTYDRILDGFFKINEHIRNISIVPNIRSGKLDATITVGESRRSITVPFSWSSDGTAKWLAILTLIRVRDSGYCIEEPENYIHPAAQRMFINILRDITSNDESNFYLINTHSETIVNELAPHELMICDYQNGTRIRRVSNPDRVRDVINETGFGLGHLYANQRL